MSELTSSRQRCSKCERTIEVCACCSEPECQAAICNGCLRVATGQAVAQPPAHGADPEMVEVELRSVAGCPHADAARALLRECLTELQLEAAVEDKVGAYPSPTILVDGEDVMGAPASQAAACRLDVPTRHRLLDALRRP